MGKSHVFGENILCKIRTNLFIPVHFLFPIIFKYNLLRIGNLFLLNQSLSEERAKTVTEHLFSMSISANRLIFAGWSESKTIEENGTFK